MVAYKWDPLPESNTWIRILTLEPGEGQQQLKGSLQSVLLEKGIDYSATSYCVGPTETPHEIRLRKADEHYSLPITASLFAMLQRFRSRTDQRRLWIDAISIDQTNGEEKADQIMLMQKVYTYTKRVLIYLGEPDHTTPLAIDLMAGIYQAVQDTPADLNLTGREWQKYHQLPLVEDAESWEPLMDFFCRPWFIRKWTIQECVLPPKATLYCGTWEAELEYMDVVIRASATYALGFLRDLTSSNMTSRFQILQGAMQFGNVTTMRKLFQAGDRFHLMDLVYHFQTSRATDLRDHLFALLGLADNVDIRELRPAYEEASILENCLRYARFFLQRTKTLEVLYRAGHQGQSKLLAPSWIPNWYGDHMDSESLYTGGPWDPIRRPSFYNIAKGTVPEIDLERDVAILRIHGVFVGRVHALANRQLLSTATTTFLSQEKQQLAECDNLLLSLQRYPTGDSLETALWKTLICGVTEDLHKATEDPYAASYHSWRKLLRNDYTTQTEKTLVEQEAYLFRLTKERFNGGKIFGLTDSGYMGMFNQSTKVGDTIVAFYGGEWPFVVRRRDYDTSPVASELHINSWDYELIGQCYIHGLMEEGQFDIKDPKHQKHCFRLGGEFEVEPPFQPHGVIPEAS